MKWKNGVYDTFNPIDIEDNEYSKINYEKLLTKLGEYEDLEEQSLLLRLKLKVGDKVWDTEFGIISSYEITGYSVGKAEDYIDEPLSETEVVYYYANCSGSVTGSFADSEIGKTLFLTKEEAEAALEKMKGGE